MQKTLSLILTALSLSTSTLSAYAQIDDKLLTIIQSNGSGASKFTYISSSQYDSDIHYGTKPTKPIQYSIPYSQNIGSIGNNTYDTLIRESATRHGVDPALVKAIIHTESSFNPYAKSPMGAQGLMQLMPGTARDMGVINVWDPADNIEGGVKYIAWLSQKFSNQDHIIAAYNAGHANVKRYGGIPPFKETRNYVHKVNSRHQNLYAHDTNLSQGGYQLAMNMDLSMTTTIKKIERPTGININTTTDGE
ncbi:lytic transglycosylase domain-containing protein [Moraxella sp. ZY200743]|uniref:lytic transglycosylase domain-containing protein n=1 Tax=Moraxella sp. ZY200743 TaxID=2911970 RepID=UPI003D7CE119